MGVKREALELFLVSLLALFLELAVIRWLATEVRIFAYFKNLPLMAASLGFGVGCFLYRKADRLFYNWFPRLCVYLILLIALALYLLSFYFLMRSQRHRAMAVAT